jgi:hypothetical protein
VLDCSVALGAMGVDLAVSRLTPDGVAGCRPR